MRKNKVKHMTKWIWKRMLACVLALVLLVGAVPIQTLAGLKENSRDKNEEILAELTEFWGDEKTAREAMDLLLKYGLIDEDGNVLTDWSGDIYIQDEAGSSRATNVTELLVMLEDENADRNQMVIVDGTEITLGDFEVMMQIESEIKRIQDTYLQDEVELTNEQAANLVSLYQQLSEGGIMLYNTRGADTLVFPSGEDQTQRVTVPETVTVAAGETTANLTITLAHAVPEGKTVTFKWKIMEGSLTGHVNVPVEGSDEPEAEGEMTFTAGEQAKTLEVILDCDRASQRWNGNQVLTVRFYDVEGALFSNGKTAASTQIDVTNDSAYMSAETWSKYQQFGYTWGAGGNGGETASGYGGSPADYEGKRYQFLGGIDKSDRSPAWQRAIKDTYNDLDIYYTFSQMDVTFQYAVLEGTVSHLEVEWDWCCWNGDCYFTIYDNFSKMPGLSATGSDGFLNSLWGDWDGLYDRYSKYQITDPQAIKNNDIIHVAKQQIDQGYYELSIRTPGMRFTDEINPTVTSVTIPEIEDVQYVPGDVIPITVTFSEPVKADGIKLAVNGETLPAASTGTGKTHTVLYTVPETGNTNLKVSSISGAVDITGHTMEENTEVRVLLEQGNLKIPTILGAVDETPAPMLGALTYYEAKADQPEKTTATVDVVLDMPTETTQRELILSDVYNDASDATIYYCGKLAASIDGGETLIPLKFDNGDAPNTMTATVEIDASTLINQQDFAMEFYQITVDKENYNTITKGDLLFGRYAVFTLTEPVPLTADCLSITTPEGWPDTPIYVNDPPEAAKLTLTANVNAPTGCTWTQTRWVSSNESIATINERGIISPLADGEVSFYLEAVNGNLEAYKETDNTLKGEGRGTHGYLSEPVTLTIQVGSAPYLRIPEESVNIRSGAPVTLRWASNLVQKNAEFANNAPTTFTIKVYKGTDTSGEPVQSHTVTYNPADMSDTTLWTEGSPNQYITLNGLSDISQGNSPSYTIVLSAEADSSVPLAKEEGYTATATVYVVSKPVSVRLERPSSLFCTNGQGILNVKYTLENYDKGNNAQFELVVTNNATGEKVTTRSTPDSANGGSFTIDLSAAAIKDNFRTLYDVSVKAKNTAEKDWSRDSFTMYIYDKNCLDILIQPVDNGRVVVSENGNQITMSNEEWIATLSQDEILALNRDIDLQSVISINYGDHAWGEASDRIKWASSNSTVAAVNYPQGAYYENIEGLPYSSYAPATQFLLSGKNDGETIVEAIHALAGNALSSEVEVTVETLKDKLYLFQFYPVGTATLTYTNGDGKLVTDHVTDENGRAAVYEASGIDSDVYVEATIGDEKYLGTVYKEDLVSQEKDAVSLELYPLNTLNLRKAATLPVYLKNPDGTNYNGDVTVRAGVYRNGVYCPDAMYNTSFDPATIPGTQDYTATVTGGKLTFYYDLTQFNTNGNTDPVTAADDIQFVLELRAEGYYPILYTATGTTNEDDAIRLSQRVLTLETVPEGQENQPFVAQQAVYFSGNESGIATDVRNKNGKLGPSTDYPDLLLNTTILWWGTDSDDGLGMELSDGSGQVLSGQRTIVGRYPFCSMPVTTNTVHLNKEQFDAIKLMDNGVRTVSLKYTRSGTAVKQEQMRWQLLNLLNVDSAIGSKDLSQRMDVLTDMIKNSTSGGVSVGNDFLALGISMATASSFDVKFLKMQLAPTKDPTVFRGMVYLGLNNFEGDNVSGVAADSSRGYDLDYFPGLEQIKGVAGQGLVGYAKTAANQVSYASQILAGNSRQGYGTSRTGDRKLSYALQGYFETEVYYDFDTNKWEMVVVTGGFTAGGGFGYEWTWNTQVGPVPVFLQLEAGLSGAVEFQAAIDRVKGGNDYLTELRIYAYLQAFGGIGFDYAVIALKLGLYGRVGVDATLRWLSAFGESTEFASDVKISGEIGIKFQVEFLFISYEKILWSQPIASYNFQSNNWNYVEDYWNEVKSGNSGSGSIIAPASYSLRASMIASTGDTAVYAADGDAALLDRDYLTEYERSYDSSGPSLGGASTFSLRRAVTRTSPIVKTLENSYPMASPVLTDDGGYLFYLDDGGDSTDATNIRVAFMTKNSSGGYDCNGVISDAGYGDSGLRAAGTDENAVAVWSRVTEQPAITEPGQSVTPDMQAGMMNSTDIMVAVRSGDNWTVKNLTENNGVADLSPVIATNGERILVAWRQVASSNTTELTSFDSRDYIYYSISEDKGGTWTDPAAVYNGTSGSVKGVEAAMLESGAAAVIFTLQNGETNADTGEYYQEIAYAIVDEVLADNGIDTNYDVVRYAQMTDDTNLDENPQIAAVKLDENTYAFVMGWHCVSSESGESDIRLAAVDAAGNRITGFVDALSSLIQNSDVGVSANFQFIKNAQSLDELSILWSDTATEDGDTKAPAHDYLSALRFRTEDNQGITKVSVTAAQQLVEMGDYTAIDSFNAYVGSDGNLYAAIQGTYYDYENPETYVVTYDDGSTYTVSVANEKTSIYTVVGAYTDTLRVDSVIPDYANIRKGTSLPVQLSVTNLGTVPMNKVEVKIDDNIYVQTTVFENSTTSAFVSIAPGETRSLMVFYTVPSEGAIPNPEYSVTGTFENGHTDDSEPEILVLNIPDLGIADGDILVDAVDGDRILQFNLYNLSDAELAYSGRSVRFNLYSDADCTEAIAPAYLTLTQVSRTRSADTLLTISDSEDLAAIDEGSYTLQYKFDLENYIKNEGFADEAGEVRDGGITVYAKAWIEQPDDYISTYDLADVGSGEDESGEILEYVSSNNVTAINLESLLKQADGAPTTITSTLDNSGAVSKVSVTLQSNSIVQKTSGNLIVTLLDESGSVLEQKQSYTGKGENNGLIILNPEGKVTMPFEFTKKGASVRVSYSDAILEDNTNVNLSSVTLDGVVLTYDEETKTYSGTTEYLSNALLTIVTEDLRASVKVNGVTYDTAMNQHISGGSNVFTIEVTSADGSKSQIYSLSVERAVPMLTMPTTSNAITYGEPLENVGLTTDWSWSDSTVVPDVVNNGYAAVKNLTDDNLYDYTNISGVTYDEEAHTLTTIVKVTVNPASPIDNTARLQTFTKGMASAEFAAPVFRGVDGKELAGAISYSYDGKTYTSASALTAVLDKLAAGAYGTITYDFAPVSTNYTSLSNGRITFKVPDADSPTIDITVGTNNWNMFWDEVSFGLFYKNTKTVTITAADDVTVNPEIKYYISDKELTEAEIKADNIPWKDYSGAFAINANSKQIVYAKATDETGRTTIANSSWIVVYTDSAVKTTDITYIKNVTGDVAADVILNGNTVAGIRNGSIALTGGKDYTVDAEGRITFKDAYLKTLSPAAHTLTVSYAPLGESYKSSAGNDEPEATQLTLTVRNPKLISVTQPEPIKGVANGTAKTAEALGLPGTVTISTEDAGITTAKVEWDLAKLASGTYDSSVLTEQSFTVNGTVALPQGIDNPDNVSRNVTIQVTVSEAGVVGVPQAVPTGGIYAANQSIVLRSSTDGADIYYTLDGTTPSSTTGTKYESPIIIEGIAGKEVVTTIKAIAVKSGMQDSNAATFTYTIRIPDTDSPTVEITIGTNKWNQFRNTVNLGLFYKNQKEVTITAFDNATADPEIKYFLSDKELTETEIKADSIAWENYSGAFTINANSRKIIYAKATDETGSTTVVNSEWIVVYADSTAGTTDITYVKNVTGDVTADVILNGNTVAGIRNGSIALTEGTDYTVDAEGRITFKDAYLKTLSPAAHTLTVSYAPLGEGYKPIAGNDEPAATQLTLTVRNPKLISVTQPEPINGVANGTAKTAEALGLPGTVTIVTEDASITTAKVTWDLANLADGSYDPSVLTEQSFTVNGTVALPEGIDNLDELSQNVTVDVTVSEAGVVGVPQAAPAGGIYAANQSVVLRSSTDGADIYYTLDGTTPSSTTGIKYESPIIIEGIAGQDKVTTIKAIAVKSGMQDSEVVTFTYTIRIPETVYQIISGTGSSWTPESSEELTIRGNGEFSKFTGVKVDGSLLDNSSYTAREGSTIITLKESYLNTLAAGTHTVEMLWTDGLASTTFTINKDITDKNDEEPAAEDNTPIEAPGTGDNTPVVWLFILLIISGTAPFFIGKKAKRTAK